MFGMVTNTPMEIILNKNLMSKTGFIRQINSKVILEN